MAVSCSKIGSRINYTSAKFSGCSNIEIQIIIKTMIHVSPQKNGGKKIGMQLTRVETPREVHVVPALKDHVTASQCVETNLHTFLTLILRRSRTGTVWFYTSTSNKRAARPKLYTESLTRDLKRMYSRFTLVRISINLRHRSSSI